MRKSDFNLAIAIAYLAIITLFKFWEHWNGRKRINTLSLPLRFIQLCWLSIASQFIDCHIISITSYHILGLPQSQQLYCCFDNKVNEIYTEVCKYAYIFYVIIYRIIIKRVYLPLIEIYLGRFFFLLLPR